MGEVENAAGSKVAFIVSVVGKLRVLLLYIILSYVGLFLWACAANSTAMGKRSLVMLE